MKRDTDRILLTAEQFDDALKAWKRKGTERALAFVFFASVPLIVAGAFMPDTPPGAVVVACATYYCAAVFFAVMTQ